MFNPPLASFVPAPQNSEFAAAAFGGELEFGDLRVDSFMERLNHLFHPLRLGVELDQGRTDLQVPSLSSCACSRPHPHTN
jgi:hypothetical protein